MSPCKVIQNTYVKWQCTNLLGGEGLHVGVGPVGDGGVGVRDRLEGLGVALDDARRQLHLGRLRLDLVGAVDVVVAGEEDQLLLSLRDLPADEFTIDSQAC